MNPEEAIRDALRAALSRRLERGVVVRTETRLAATRAPALIETVSAGGLPTSGARLTRQSADGSTIHVCICGINSCGDDSVCG